MPRKEDEINVPMTLGVFKDKGSRRWSNGVVRGVGPKMSAILQSVGTMSLLLSEEL